MNPDFKDMFSALCGANAEFLVVGGYALAAHGCPRATGDIDIWIRPSPKNAAAVWNALVAFGAPMDRVAPADLENPNFIFQIGVPPNRINLIASIDGVAFEEAWSEQEQRDIDGIVLPVISRRLLIQNKKATGRPRDLADVVQLEKSGG